MTKEEMAALLNGREYGEEITPEEKAEAKRSGLVVVFGASDDLMEVRGAEDNEVGAGIGDYTPVLFDRKGLLPSRDSFDADGSDDAELEEYFIRKKTARAIRVIWGEGEYSWTYKTDIPHATFDIMEDREKYCRGIVFSVESLPSPGKEK